MIETEAKTKWCPMTRYRTVKFKDIDGNVTGTEGLSNLPTNDSYCIASACMAWREIKKQTTPSTPDEVLGGYCGLAGRP